MNLDSNSNVLSETGWSGSGGGVSAYEAFPAYQTGWVTSTRRNVPDVSYDADPNTGFSVYISNYERSTGWITVGGTSSGAPQWAALSALANSLRAVPLASSDSPIYSLATAAYATDFRDITVGSNGTYSCKTGYDCVTGLGSPRANALVPALSTH